MQNRKIRNRAQITKISCQRDLRFISWPPHCVRRVGKTGQAEWLVLHRLSGHPSLYMHAKFQVSSFSHSEDKREMSKLKTGPPPTLCGGSGSPSNTMFHGPQECSPQTVSWSIHIQPFLHSEARWTTWRTDGQTDRETETANTGKNRLHRMHSMPPKNTMLLWNITSRNVESDRNSTSCGDFIKNMKHEKCYELGNRLCHSR